MVGEENTGDFKDVKHAFDFLLILEFDESHE
jgi:hypothetical protein